MVFDIILACFVGAGFYYGYKKGIVFALLSFVAVFFGIFGVMRFSEVMAELLSANTELAAPVIPIVASILVFIVFYLAMRLTAWVITEILKIVKLNFINKLAGGLLFGVILLLLFSVFTWLFDYAGYIPESAQKSSKTYVYVQQMAPILFDLAGDVLPFFEGLFDQLKDTLDNAPAAEPPEVA